MHRNENSGTTAMPREFDRGQAKELSMRASTVSVALFASMALCLAASAQTIGGGPSSPGIGGGAQSQPGSAPGSPGAGGSNGGIGGSETTGAASRPANPPPGVNSAGTALSSGGAASGTVGPRKQR